MATGDLFQLMQYVLELAGVIFCMLVVWVVISPIPFGLRYALERTGFMQLFRYRRLLRCKKFVLWPLQAFKFVKTHAGFLERGPSVRVVMDERLSRVKESLLQARSAVEQACDKIVHFGQGGSAALVADLTALEKRTEEVSLLGGEIEEDLVGDYEAHAGSTLNLVIGLTFLTVFAIGNGIFINQFMQNLIPNYFRGIPISLVFSIILIAFEAGAGWLGAVGTAHGRRKRNIVLLALGIAAVISFCGIEAAIVGIMSYNFDLDLPLLDTYPALRFWLAPLGVVFAALTGGVSFAVHQFSDELSSASGAKRLHREIKAVNKYVDGLPVRWQKIRNGAREARAVLDSYGAALGARDGTTPEEGAIGGLVSKIGIERQELSKAFGAAKIEDWAQVVEGAPADDRREVIKNVGLLFITVVATTAGIYGFSWFFSVALRNLVSSPPFGWVAAAVIFVASLYVLGFMPFQRLQNADPRSGRVFPYRSNGPEQVCAMLVALIASLSLLVGGYLAYGAPGILIGLILTVGGAALTWMGYHFERSCRGLTVLASLSLSLSAVILAASLALAAASLFWGVAILSWLIWVFLFFLGWPTGLAVAWWQRSRSGSQQGEIAQTQPAHT